MLTRRGLITSGAGLALAGSGLRLAPSEAAAGPLDLPAALPEGARVEIRLADAPPAVPPELRAEFEAWDRASANALEVVERLARGSEGVAKE